LFCLYLQNVCRFAQTCWTVLTLNNIYYCCVRLEINIFCYNINLIYIHIFKLGVLTHGIIICHNVNLQHNSSNYYSVILSFHRNFAKHTFRLVECHYVGTGNPRVPGGCAAGSLGNRYDGMKLVETYHT